MKSLRVSVALFGAAILVLTYSSKPAAFHSGGVAECAGCHSMHSPKAGGSALLIGIDQSSTCLSCHEHAGDTGPTGYHISTAAADLGTTGLPKQRTPGGDFGWLKKSYTYNLPAGSVPATETEDGATHGHNIVAADFGYVADTSNSGVAPGGTFVSNKLACSSCHNPHGTYRRLTDGTVALAGAPIKASGSYNGAANEPTATEAVGVYRLLAGAGYKTQDGTVINYPGVPAAKVPSTYNQSEVTNQVKTAYGVKTSGGHSTWGNWCGTCHPNMHSTGNYVHPVDQGLGTTLGNYNSYVKSGDMAGTQATSYLSLVPYATNSGDYNALAALAGNASPTYSGPTAGDQVTCLSCHRAHASGMMYGLRFDIEYEFMTKNSQYIGLDSQPPGDRLGVQSRGRNSADWEAAYYDRPASKFATYQRVLCNKCHAKD